MPAEIFQHAITSYFGIIDPIGSALIFIVLPATISSVASSASSLPPCRFSLADGIRQIMTG